MKHFEIMKIQLISSLLSIRVLENIRSRTGKYPAYAVQKFYRVLAEGFVKNGVKIDVVSNPPAFAYSKRYDNIKSDSENGVYFHYLPAFNLSIFRHISLFINAFFTSFKFCLFEKEERVIICDTLCYSTCIGALLASKLCNTRIVGIVTDLPWLVDEEGKINSKIRLFHAFLKCYIRKFDYYIFLTEQMNTQINIKNKKYVVIEGFANIDMQESKNSIIEKKQPKQLLYAGFLQAKYGLRMLVNAFMSLKNLDAKLVVYGTGPYSDELKECAKADDRIEYRGLASNEEIVQAELHASVLVNPRPTHEEYTKYSFPSKNMEYMASGTPILTTRLPGMPAEYYPYIYSFDEETTEGYARIINKIMSMSVEELHKKGTEAKAWVLKNKNNIHQCRRIINMLVNNK